MFYIIMCLIIVIGFENIRLQMGSIIKFLPEDLWVNQNEMVELVLMNKICWLKKISEKLHEATKIASIFLFI